ncbi:MAG: DUF4373 domain-containing protein [Sphingobacteriales bacterium]|nr:MAG: DUF4373 domain-containing protein [Sphingobacteriales bacterium]
MRKPTGFRHPLNTRHDDRISILIADHGAMGYGVYWMIIEFLYRQPGMRIAHTDKTIRWMASLTGIEHRQFRHLLQDLIEHYELFVVQDDYLTSTLTYHKPRKQKEPAQPEGDLLQDSAAPDTKRITPLSSPGATRTTPPSSIRSMLSAEEQPPASLIAHNAAKMAENTATPQQRNDSTTTAGQQHSSNVAAPRRQPNSSRTTPLQHREKALSKGQTNTIPPTKALFQRGSSDTGFLKV